MKRPKTKIARAKHDYVVKDLKNIGINVVEIDEYSEIVFVLVGVGMQNLDLILSIGCVIG